MSKDLTPPAFLNRQPLALYEAARRALAEAKPSREVLKFSVFLPPRHLPLALGAGKDMIAMVSVLSRLVTIPGPGDVRPAARRGRQGASPAPRVLGPVQS